MPFSRLALLALAFPALAAAQTVPLTRGMIITHSLRIRPGIYRLSADSSLDSAIVTIQGNDISVDMRGVSLVGSPEDADPDRAAGVGIRVQGGRNVRIEGAHVRGYKIAVMARGTHGLTLRRNDLSYNWKPRLYSLVEHESLVDWNYFQHQEKDEWLRYGAAIFLEDVHGGAIRDNTARQGMNGLMMTRCDSLTVQNDDISFDSGLGIGLYRSSDNSIEYNRFDYDVRGYSEGFYRRGQDSAGILLYEQSMRNVIAFNSGTHGGDGFFLWAGQSTMDNGQGGANDNIVFENDFRFSPANAIEATFSRNSFVHNRLGGSDYGVWGGYSYESQVLANDFTGDRIGIGIEHGQDWRIEGNRFRGDSTAISLWANPIEPSDWGYPKHRDTRSRDYYVTSNQIQDGRVGLRVRDTRGLAVRDNRFVAVDSPLVIPESLRAGVGRNDVLQGEAARTAMIPLSATANLEAATPAPPLADSIRRRMPSPWRGGMSVASHEADLPRSAIVVDEWGPYDYRSPRLWPIDSTHAVPLRLRTLGPSGRWRVVERKNVASVSRTEGAIGDTITVTPRPDTTGEWRLTLEYRGKATTSPRGELKPTRAGYRFSWGAFEPPQNWDARFFAWTDATDPRSKPAAFDSLFASGKPLLEKRISRIDYEWYRPLVKELPLEKWAMSATTTVDLPPGSYTLRTLSDDAIRVWVDGKLAVDDWKPHESVVDSALLAAGRHVLRVDYYQVDGWTEVRLDIVR